jgi:uncharacterized protein YceK
MKMQFRFMIIVLMLSLVISACTTTAPRTQPPEGTIVIRAGTGDGG